MERWDRIARAGRKREKASRLLQTSSFILQPSIRVGLGSDIHRLVRGRKLILGGVKIPFEKGPLGHSDGDALAHAITDALLGAAALGDIGRHFPDTSPRWRNASSLIFLREARKLLAKAGYAIINVDSTVELERPKLRANGCGGPGPCRARLSCGFAARALKNSRSLRYEARSNSSRN